MKNFNNFQAWSLPTLTRNVCLIGSIQNVHIKRQTVIQANYTVLDSSYIVFVPFVRSLHLVILCISPIIGRAH